MKNICVDVVVPMYNGERFIPDLISTFENQTFKNFKVIFVDDGSTDNTSQVLHKELGKASFENVVVHQENRGLPGARNAGINHATAPWITFVDCDDLLDVHFLEYLYKSITENDVDWGYCGFQPVEAGRMDKIKKAEEYTCSVVSAKECMQEYYSSWFCSCCMIISREFLCKNGLLFDEKCTYCEDIPFITEVIEAADKIAKIDCDLYIYLLRQGSLIRSPKIEKYKVGLAGFLRMSERLAKKDSQAAKTFSRMGVARYMIATLRKGAVQLPLKQFKELAGHIDEKALKEQIGHLPLLLKISGYIYLISKTVFYLFINILFND